MREYEYERWSHFDKTYFKEAHESEAIDTFFERFVWPAHLARLYIALLAAIREARLVREWALANFKVYWVCASDQDREELRELLLPQGTDEGLESHFEEVFRFIPAQRPDILLQEAYQRAALCLPPGGMGYQFVHQVPPDPPDLLIPPGEVKPVDQPRGLRLVMRFF